MSVGNLWDLIRLEKKAWCIAVRIMWLWFRVVHNVLNNPFLFNVPLKTSENQRISNFFWGRKRSVGRKWVNILFKK